MGVFAFIILAIFAWFAYNLFIKVIWPVYKTTNRVRERFKHMAEQGKQYNDEKPSQQKPKEKAGEYIDFEEVK